MNAKLKIAKVIENLESIKANKETIVKYAERGEYRYICPDDKIAPERLVNYATRGDYFDLNSGLCRNADLWSLNDLIDDLGNTLMDDLGNSFINQTDRDTENSSSRDTLYPVAEKYKGVTYNLKTFWLNPERWMYVDHCIFELKKVLNHYE